LKAYWFLDLNFNVIVESKDVEFIKDKIYNDSKTVAYPIPTQEKDLNDLNPSINRENEIRVHDLSIEPWRSQRVRKEKILGPDFVSSQAIVFLLEGNRDNVLSEILILLNIEEDPKKIKETVASRDVAFWKEAINDEMDSILSNNTWILVYLPLGTKTIGCKWVFRRKYNTCGSLQTFKVRLVVKGFRQKEGIDYFDTYALVARIASIRVL
jgi:hypothetical protein